MQINGRTIGLGERPYLIAEMSGNHNHSLDRALEIVTSAAEHGADAIKLQTYTADTITLDVDGPGFTIEDENSLWNGRRLHELTERLNALIAAEELGITLPDYLGYGSVEEHHEIAALISDAEASPTWTPAEGAARPFDVAVFRRGELASHLGVVIAPGLMIHMVGEDCAKLERYDTGRWGHRLKGLFRHVQCPVKPGAPA